MLTHSINKEPADWYLGMKIIQEFDSEGKLLSATLTQESYIAQLCKMNGIDIVTLRLFFLYIFFMKILDEYFLFSTAGALIFVTVLGL